MAAGTSRSRNKDQGALNALLFWVHSGAKRPSMLVVLALAPTDREGFYTTSVAA